MRSQNIRNSFVNRMNWLLKLVSGITKSIETTRGNTHTQNIKSIRVKEKEEGKAGRLGQQLARWLTGWLVI